jgi:hypothetical protein
MILVYDTPHCDSLNSISRLVLVDWMPTLWSIYVLLSLNRHVSARCVRTSSRRCQPCNTWGLCRPSDKNVHHEDIIILETSSSRRRRAAQLMSLRTYFSHRRQHAPWERHDRYAAGHATQEPWLVKMLLSRRPWPAACVRTSSPSDGRALVSLS